MILRMWKSWKVGHWIGENIGWWEKLKSLFVGCEKLIESITW